MRNWFAGRFHTEHRGLVDVKGKGWLDTYWLRGKEDSDNIQAFLLFTGMSAQASLL